MPTRRLRSPSPILLALMLALSAFSTACVDDLDEPWQLDHDRVIAVRATPPSLASGQRAQIDALLAHRGAPTSVTAPTTATVALPASLADTLSFSAGAWTVTAPDAARLDAARSELGLTADAPVPLTLHVTFGDALPATKTLWLGLAAENPQLGVMTVDGAPVESGGSGAEPVTMITLPTGSDFPLTIPADPTDEIAWLSSVGTLHDFDLPTAYFRLEPEDLPADAPTGELVVVRRDARGGVAWRSWSFRAQ